MNYISKNSVMLYKLVGIVKKNFSDKITLDEKTRGLEENSPMSIAIDDSGEYYFGTVQKIE